MAVAVGVVIVAGAEDTLQGTVDHSVVEDPLNRGYPGQDIVAGVALVCEYFFDVLVDVAVEIGGQVGLQGDIAVFDKLLHPVVVEQASGHDGSPF